MCFASTIQGSLDAPPTHKEKYAPQLKALSTRFLFMNT